MYFFLLRGKGNKRFLRRENAEKLLGLMNKFSSILFLWKNVIKQKVRGCADYHFLL